MKRILLALVLLLTPSFAWAQCTGVFPSATICGSVSGGVPGPVSTSVLTGVPGGTTGQVQYNNSGVFGGFTPSGDCTVVTATGVFTCTKTNGVSFGPFATDNAAAATAALNAFTSTLQGVVPASGGSNVNLFLNQTGAFSAAPASTNVTGTNFLSNTNWQVDSISGSGSGFITAVRSDGTANQTPISATSFNTSANSVTFLTANTEEFVAGVTLFTVSGSGFPNSAFRATSVVANTSVTTTLPLNLTSPGTSSARTLTPISQGNQSGVVFDDWKVTPTTLNVWADDFSTNIPPGSIRTLGMRKDVGTAEQYYWQALASDLPRYLGRQITCGALVNQKVQGGSGTWRLDMFDNNSTVYSTSGTGSSFGGYEFRSMTFTPSASLGTGFGFGITLDGNAGDIYYFAGPPTCYYGDAMTASNLAQKPQELLHVALHWNPNLFLPLAITFPTATIGFGDYGFTNQDLAAISFGAVHNSIKAVDLKFEYTTPTVNMLFLTSKSPFSQGTFGPECSTQVANQIITCGPSRLPVINGGLFDIYVNVSGGVVTNATADFGDVELSP